MKGQFGFPKAHLVPEALLYVFEAKAGNAESPHFSAACFTCFLVAALGHCGQPSGIGAVLDHVKRRTNNFLQTIANCCENANRLGIVLL